jgi:cytochrome c-type biogenesis protein
MNTVGPEVSWIFAFLAGVVSFLSPCVLPLIPGYVSMVSKLSLNELTDKNTEERLGKILIPSVFFVLGFSVVFVALGTSASFIGVFLKQNRLLLLKISGAIIIIFGLFTMNIIKIPQLYRNRRISLPEGDLGVFGTFLLGVAFGFGWTPCVGPILASILLYASTAEVVGKGAALLFVYSIGLGVPFLLTGVALSRALRAFSWIKRHYGLYNTVVGGALVIIGVLMLTNNLYYLNIYGQKALDWAGLDFWKGF